MRVINKKNRKKITEKKRLKKQKEDYIEEIPESDEYFYYIVGYTSNGAPYGITWEEYYTSQFYYIAGYKENGKPYGITWEEFERSMPSEEYKENYRKFMSKQTPFDE